MRHQLFDYVIPVAPPPRLQPNIYAKIARRSYRAAIHVVVFWLALCAGLAAALYFKPHSATTFNLEFSGANSAAKNLGILDQQFPNLNALMTVTISNDDPAALKLARLTLISELESGDSAFNLVLAPGAGDYYQNHASYYYAADELKSRVDYALSLKPLFAAVAASPTTESLATLVNEVSASITLGRDPQGLDALFDEASKSVQSLMEGNDRHVDWTKIAGLNFEPQAKEAVVLALPKRGQNIKAAEIAAAAIAKISATPGTKVGLQQAKSATQSRAPPDNLGRSLPFIALAIIFVGFVLFATIGRINLAVMILLPVLLAEFFCFTLMRIIFGDHVQSLWPVFLGVAICGLQISARLSFAIIETLAISVSKQSAVMLAFQKQGSGILWFLIIASLVWSGWFAIGQTPFVEMAGIMLLSLAVGCCAATSLIPACCKLSREAISWRAADWFLPIYEGLFANQFWWRLRKFIAIIFVFAGVSSLFFLPRLLVFSASNVDRNQTVNVLATSEQDAKRAVEKLSKIPQAQSVRWLGAFLPAQAQQKRQILKGLDNQFPHFQPLSPQEPAALRDQITSLLVSLEEIATSSATRPELQKAAHNFRRSLEILSNTTSNAEVLEFENRIFGALNLLADHADGLANLAEPELETLDPKLKALFVSTQNIFRLDVVPMEGIAPAGLAHILSDNGLPVAHPALQADGARQVLLAASAMVLAAMLLLGLLTMVFAIREISGSIASLVAAFVAFCLVLGMAEISNLHLSQSTLLQFSALLAATLVIIASAFLKRQITDQSPPDALHAAEVWLPTMVIAAVAAPAGFLNFTPWSQDLGIFAIILSAVTSAIAVLLRPTTLALRRFGF